MEKINLVDVILDMSNDRYLDSAGALDFIEKDPEIAESIRTYILHSNKNLTVEEYNRDLALVGVYRLAFEMGNCNFSKVTNYDPLRKTWQRLRW